MKDSIKTGIAVVGLSVAALVFVFSDPVAKMLKNVETPRLPVPVVNAEFVCYADGELTENHVGIKRAQLWDRTGHLWNLQYVDQPGEFFFVQSPGETCGVESYETP